MKIVGLVAIFLLNMLNLKWLDEKLKIMLKISEKGVILQGSVVGSKEKCSSKFEEAKV